MEDKDLPKISRELLKLGYLTGILDPRKIDLKHLYKDRSYLIVIGKCKKNVVK